MNEDKMIQKIISFLKKQGLSKKDRYLIVDKCKEIMKTELFFGTLPDLENADKKKKSKAKPKKEKKKKKEKDLDDDFEDAEDIEDDMIDDDLEDDDDSDDDEDEDF